MRLFGLGGSIDRLIAKHAQPEQAPPLVVPLCDSRRAALMREHGEEEGARMAAEMDREERARLKAGWRMLRGMKP